MVAAAAASAAPHRPQQSSAYERGIAVAHEELRMSQIREHLLRQQLLQLQQQQDPSSSLMTTLASLNTLGGSGGGGVRPVASTSSSSAVVGGGGATGMSGRLSLTGVGGYNQQHPLLNLSSFNLPGSGHLGGRL
jgi:hypothetical protein